MSKPFEVIYEEVPTKVPDHYRLDGRIGMTYCALMFPKGLPLHRAMKIIRRRLGLIDWDNDHK